VFCSMYNYSGVILCSVESLHKKVHRTGSGSLEAQANAARQAGPPCLIRLF